MPFAARTGDKTSHGSPLGPGPGSTNVLIQGMPAFRALLDKHACPLANGPQPHVGGVVLVGSKSVLINKFPAVRMNDKVVEAGPPNTILVASTSVLIGG